MASASADSCETGCEVNLKWIVTSGGSVNYTVSVDGTEQSGASAKLTCQPTAGTQSVKVKATDRTYPQLTATRTLSLTVTKPAPPTSATAQIHARRLADNRVEFTLRLKDGTEVITANRYMKLPEVTAGRWYASSAFTTSIEGVEYALGVVSARLDNTVCPAQVEVTFIPMGGERITPTQYKLSVDREADLWASTSEFDIPLVETASSAVVRQGDAVDRMTEAPKGQVRGRGAMVGSCSETILNQRRSATNQLRPVPISRQV